MKLVNLSVFFLFNSSLACNFAYIGNQNKRTPKQVVMEQNIVNPSELNIPQFVEYKTKAPFDLEDGIEYHNGWRPVSRHKIVEDNLYQPKVCM